MNNQLAWWGDWKRKIRSWIWTNGAKWLDRLPWRWWCYEQRRYWQSNLVIPSHWWACLPSFSASAVSRLKHRLTPLLIIEREDWRGHQSTYIVSEFWFKDQRTKIDRRIELIYLIDKWFLTFYFLISFSKFAVSSR